MLIKRNVTTWDGRVVRCAFVKGINYPISDTGKRYITDYQIKNEYPEIWETFQNVINRKSNIMNEFILDLFSKLDNDGILTWNQFNCLLPKKDKPKSEPQKRFKIDLNPNNRLKSKPDTKQSTNKSKQ